MQSLPFEDPFAKVDNARSHIALVEKRYVGFTTTSPHYRLSNGPIMGVDFGSGLPVPKTIGVAVGDALHNLRAALDITAGDVVQASEKSRKGVYFPFAENEFNLDEQIKKKNFHKATPAAIQLLRSLRPYHGGNVALRALHDLDVADKHQSLVRTTESHTVSRMRIGNIHLNGVTFSGNTADIVVDGAQPFALPDNVTHKLIFAPGIPFAGDEVIPTLYNLADMTFDIIQAFEKLFGHGAAQPLGSQAAANISKPS